MPASSRWMTAVLLACLATGCKEPAPDETAAATPTPAGTPAATPASGCAVPPTDVILSPQVPCDASFRSQDSTLDEIQRDFDVYSWNTFIALNWPPDGSGQIGRNGDNPTVWETWKESNDIFLPDGAKPSPFGSPGQLPPACQGLMEPGMRVVTQIGKTPTLLEEDVQPFQTGPLVDQNGQYTRFEILVNEPMFDTIVADQLYSQQGQQAYAKAGNSVQFGCGSNGSPTQVGAIMVKAAWKVLGPGDDPARFHKVDALVYTPTAASPAQQCVKSRLGLVGLHIAHKTQSAPQWIWSTFEQVDNAPQQGETPSGHYNYHNAACKDCPVNEPPPQPWDPLRPGQPPSQVVRAIPITAATVQLNQTAAGLLKGVNPGSVWQFYELVSTQWPTAPAPANPFCPAPGQPGPTLQQVQTETDGNPAPQFLANTTLETYIQGSVPNASSSCIRCHNGATATTGEASDFTYLLERAQSTGGSNP